jgi:hypothetical protein
MANSLSKNPIVLDTPGTGVVISTTEKDIQAIVYRAGTSAGAACQLLDGSAGDVVFDAAGAANTTIVLTLQEPLRVSGLYLPSTGLEANGKLLIYTSPSRRPYYL